MKSLYTTLIFVLFALMSFSQNKNRVEITGQIIADSLDREAITIYNITSGKGATTDKDGNFAIDVFLNDIIQISAIQFLNSKITIDENIMTSKTISIVLIERVNELNEVVIFPYGLSGNIAGDISTAKVLRPNYDALYFGIENKEDFEFADDYATRVENQTLNTKRLQNGVDIVGVATLVTSLFKSKKTEQPKRGELPKRIFEVYSRTYLSERFEFSEPELAKFIYYVEDEGFDYELLKENREFDFFEFMFKQKEAYLKP